MIPLRPVQIVEKLEVGGLERLAVDLALAQLSAGHSPALVCLVRKGALAAEAEAAGIPVLELGKAPGFSFRAVSTLASFLRLHRADIVHTHNAVVHHYGVLAGFRAGVRAIVNTRHGTGVLHAAGRQDLYYRFTMPLTRAVVCVCEDGRRFFTRERGVPVSKTRVIWGGIPLARFLDSPLPSRPAGQGIWFGTLGRMVEAKAHDVLLEAFAKVSRLFPQARLRVAGGGPLFGHLRGLCDRLGLQSVVSLDGAVSDTPAFYRSLDVFVLSSISEGLPVVVLEAMASGLPVVSTRIGGVPEVAPERRTAWFCPPGDPRALSEAMLAAVQDRSHWLTMGQNARSIAASHFGIDSMRRRYDELFYALRDGRALPGLPAPDLS